MLLFDVAYLAVYYLHQPCRCAGSLQKTGMFEVVSGEKSLGCKKWCWCWDPRRCPQTQGLQEDFGFSQLLELG